MAADRNDRPNRRDDRGAGGRGDGQNRPNFRGGDRNGGSDRPRPPFRPGGSDRPSFGGGDRPNFRAGDRPSGGDRPNFRGGDRPSGGDRPDFRGGDRSDRPRPPYRPGNDRPDFRGGDRQGGSDRPSFRGGDRTDRPRPPFRPGGSDRPDFRGGDRSERPAPPFRPGGPRPDGSRFDRGRSNGSDGNDYQPRGPRFEGGRRDDGQGQDRNGYGQRPDNRRFGDSGRPPFAPRGGNRERDPERKGASAPYRGKPDLVETPVNLAENEIEPDTQEVLAVSKRKAPAVRLELPTVSESGEFEELDTEEMVYIAYGEQGEDIAFDITDELSEGILITNQMREDGFEAKLFQGRVIYTPEEE